METPQPFYLHSQDRKTVFRVSPPRAGFLASGAGGVTTRRDGAVFGQVAYRLPTAPDTAIYFVALMLFIL
ncbi:MAG: hypothetical protein JJD98_02010 [Polaromonas sp.]|nr:hypothetical protein [Polaromonas sp.]